jgi:hypothetical protein
MVSTMPHLSYRDNALDEQRYPGVFFKTAQVGRFKGHSVQYLAVTSGMLPSLHSSRVHPTITGLSRLLLGMRANKQQTGTPK